MKFTLLTAVLFIPAIVTGQSTLDCILKAKALEEGGKNSQAAALVSETLMTKKTSALYVARADAEMLSGNYNAALNDYNSANAIDKSSGEYGIARTYALMGDAVNSLTHLDKSITSVFRKSEKEIMLDPSFNKIENTPDWRLFWKKERYTLADRTISEIEFYSSSGKTDDAAEALANLRTGYPGTAQADYGEAIVDLSAGKFQDAVKLLTVLSGNDPSDTRYLQALAKGQEGSGNPVGAATTYSVLIGMEVPDAGLLLKRAECYRKSGETANALADAERYLTIYPDNRYALSLAGKIESAAGDNLKAISYFTANLKLHPNDPQCYIDRADAYMLSKSWDWAGKDYSMSLDLDPSNAVVWLNKGISLMRSGKNEDACHDFRQAMSLGNKQAADYISRYCIK